MKITCKYDIEGFCNDLGLSIEEIADLYFEFIKEIDFELSKFNNLLIEKDWDAIKKSLHNIKGISVNYRITNIYEETVKIYGNLNSQKYADIDIDIYNLYAISKSALQEIEEYFRQRELFL